MTTRLRSIDDVFFDADYALYCRGDLDNYDRYRVENIRNNMLALAMYRANVEEHHREYGF